MSEARVIEGISVGMRIEVRNNYLGTWSNGFEVAEATTTGLRVRRLSDGSVLPGAIALEDVRRSREIAAWRF